MPLNNLTCLFFMRIDTKALEGYSGVLDYVIESIDLCILDSDSKNSTLH